MDRKNIEKIAKTDDDRLLLAKLWDKINSGMQRAVPAFTGFLTPREQVMSRYLFGDGDGLFYFGGYEGAERRILCYLPEYMDESFLSGPGAPVVCLRATFYQGDSPSHRDFLGALTGTGIAREAAGDILVCRESCDFFVTSEIAPYVLQNFTFAGRTKIHLSSVPLSTVRIPEANVKVVKGTLTSLRLDSVISAGFQISRGAAGKYISAGRASLDGIPCEKPDRPVSQGQTVSVRGLGKILLKSVGGQTKKGRTAVTVHRYL